MPCDVMAFRDIFIKIGKSDVAKCLALSLDGFSLYGWSPVSSVLTESGVVLVLSLTSYDISVT